MKSFSVNYKVSDTTLKVHNFILFCTSFLDVNSRDVLLEENDEDFDLMNTNSRLSLYSGTLGKKSQKSGSGSVSKKISSATTSASVNKPKNTATANNPKDSALVADSDDSESDEVILGNFFPVSKFSRSENIFR